MIRKYIDLSITQKASVLIIWAETNLMRNIYQIFKKILFVYLQREEKGGRKIRRETPMQKQNIYWPPPAHTPTDQGLNPQPRHVPHLVIQLVTSQPLVFQDSTQPTKSHQSGPDISFNYRQIFNNEIISLNMVCHGPVFTY